MEFSEQRTALVTGAAGGIGAAVAAALAGHGVAVAAVDRDADQLRDTVAKLAADGARVTALPADVSSEDDVEAVVDAAERELGPLDFLVNCAGVLRVGGIAGFSYDDWRATFMTNATGVFLMSRAAIRRMVPRGSGALVTVVSNAAAVPRYGMGAYAASKSAAAMLTRTIGLEVAEHGIRCNVVAPGSTDTPMLRSMWKETNGLDETLDGRLDTYRVGIPLRKLGRPEDVAEAVVFLLSDRASHITLSQLTVDGGAALGA